MAKQLAIKKRMSYVAITDMKAEVIEVDGKFVRACLNCGKPIPPKNRKYCSLDCSDEFFAKHNQRGLAKLVYKRDQGKCQKCGWKNPVYPVSISEWRKIAPKRRKFVADHIIPISLGGSEFDLENIQLLCEVCDREKTKKDQAEIAKRRRLIRHVGNGGNPLTTFLKEL